jgi:hypothetical protein
MRTVHRKKFSSQAAPEVLAALRQIAKNQGRQFQAVLDEALRDYIDRQHKEHSRRHVLSAFASSLNEFDTLYREFTVLSRLDECSSAIDVDNFLISV